MPISATFYPTVCTYSALNSYTISIRHIIPPRHQLHHLSPFLSILSVCFHTNLPYRLHNAARLPVPFATCRTQRNGTLSNGSPLRFFPTVRTTSFRRLSNMQIECGARELHEAFPAETRITCCPRKDKTRQKTSIVPTDDENRSFGNCAVSPLSKCEQIFFCVFVS